MALGFATQSTAQAAGVGASAAHNGTNGALSTAPVVKRDKQVGFLVP